MNCNKCGADLPEGSVFCCFCGKKQLREKKKKARGNGQGSVFKLPSGKYKAVVTVGYYLSDDGERHRKTHSQVFPTKKEAIAALPRLLNEPVKKQKKSITFKELYDKWLPTHRAGKSTMDCYKAAFKHFEPVWFYPMEDIDVDDLQECLDTCGKGKRTQENMKALCGLIYKYGIPRQAIPENLNLAQFIVVGGDKGAHRESFDDIQIEKIRQQIGITPYADYVYSLIYLGFRPGEFLLLDISRYNAEKNCFTGGGKTAAGTNRIVTISPKIRPYVTAIIGKRTEGPVFCDENGEEWELRDFTEKAFYPVLEAAGIDNPMVEIGGGVQRHKYTPHTCRHTFATLMKNINAPSKDKLALIGHSSEEMLRYYQDVDISGLEKITNAL